MEWSQAFVIGPIGLIFKLWIWIHLCVICSSCPNGEKWVGFFREYRLKKTIHPWWVTSCHLLASDDSESHVASVMGVSFPFVLVAISGSEWQWCLTSCVNIGNRWSAMYGRDVSHLFVSLGNSTFCNIFVCLKWRDSALNNEHDGGVLLYFSKWNPEPVTFKVGSWPWLTWWRVLNTEEESFGKSSSCCNSTVQEHCFKWLELGATDLSL